MATCQADLTYTIQVTADQIEIAALAQHDRGSGLFSLSCSDILTIHLDQPIGSRRVVDASSGQIVELLR